MGTIFASFHRELWRAMKTSMIFCTSRESTLRSPTRTHFELYKKSGRVRNIEQRINYISELLVGELYIFAVDRKFGHSKISKAEKVSLGTKGGSATTTGPIVFERLGIRP